MTEKVKNAGIKHLSPQICFVSIGGSVVECSPATRAARVRFPADAILFLGVSVVFVATHLICRDYQWYAVSVNDSFIDQVQ